MTAAPVTAKDIGNRLGLSQPTVSRILSGADGHRVSAETRRRVLEAAAEMGYRPNGVARSLRRRRTNIVGVYTGYGSLDARNAFLAGLIGGLQRACDAHRLDLLLHGVFRGASTDDIYREMADGRVDGLFVHSNAEDPLIEKLRASSLPVVALADAVPGVPSVVADDAEGTRLLLDHLWARGHRRIGFVRPTHRFDSVDSRAEAFTREMMTRGVPEAHRPVFSIQLERTGPLVDRWATLPEPPTALCCWNDLTAYDLLQNCRARGIAVPGDLAVVGFDGLVDPRLPGRVLTTVLIPLEEITARAAALLVQQIEGREAPPRSAFPVTVIAGDTA